MLIEPQSGTKINWIFPLSILSYVCGTVFEKCCVIGEGVKNNKLPLISSHTLEFLKFEVSNSYYV